MNKEEPMKYICLVSQLPGFKYGLGPVEIRPVVDLTEMIKTRRVGNDWLTWMREPLHLSC